MPSAAVAGMASSDTRRVVSSEFQAEPVSCQPKAPWLTEKAVRKYSRVKLLSLPTAFTKPPNRMMP